VSYFYFNKEGNTMPTLAQITQSIMQDPDNQSFTAKSIEPLFAAPTTARINIVGQAPGVKAQESRLYWNDKSGDRLREWLDVDRDTFYHSGMFAVIPMDFYYPGKGKSGDLPPRKDFAEKWLAVPVVQGVKSETERFAGALDTYTIEAMMQDGKALQSGTSHFLGQNFAKSFDVTFLNKENKPEYVWATSWGVSTRLIGALIMTHSDDNGLVLPPKIAPIQVAIIPIFKGEEQLKEITAKLQPAIDQLRALGITVKYDDADNKRPGFKFADYELKGVPVRLAMGGRDLENNTIEVMRRDTLEKDRVSFDGMDDDVKNPLEEMENKIF